MNGEGLAHFEKLFKKLASASNYSLLLLSKCRLTNVLVLSIHNICKLVRFQKSNINTYNFRKTLIIFKMWKSKILGAGHLQLLISGIFQGSFLNQKSQQNRQKLPEYKKVDISKMARL